VFGPFVDENLCLNNDGIYKLHSLGSFGMGLALLETNENHIVLGFT
jgi:hypothetical protein